MVGCGLSPAFITRLDSLSFTVDTALGSATIISLTVLSGDPSPRVCYRPLVIESVAIVLLIRVMSLPKSIVPWLLANLALVFHGKTPLNILSWFLLSHLFRGPHVRLALVCISCPQCCIGCCYSIENMNLGLFCRHHMGLWFETLPFM